MKTEAFLWAGVSCFFGGIAILYGWWSGEPAGTAALIVACAMGLLITFFLTVQYRRRGLRPQDRRDAEIAENTGPLEFLPPGSHFPVLTAAGFALTAVGLVVGFWLFGIGLGILARGIFGMVFQYVHRGEE